MFLLLYLMCVCIMRMIIAVVNLLSLPLLVINELYSINYANTLKVPVAVAHIKV